VQGFDGIVIGNERDGHIFWNPLKDDGDALRLAVKLRMSLVMFSIYVRVDTVDYEDIYEEYGDDPYTATRRAIVRAAAEIGKQMEKNNGN